MPTIVRMTSRARVHRELFRARIARSMDIKRISVQNRLYPERYTSKYGFFPESRLH